jgi:hypothetical protein
MSESQLRVKLLVAAGIVGASLLAASFVGCSSAPPSQASAPFASYNGSPMFNGTNQPTAAPYPGAPAAAPGVSGYSQQNRQAFLAEAQQQGGQPNLTAQDVVAMSRAGMPDTQIAIAIQQRGAALKTSPGVGEFLASSGVNPAVLNGPAPQMRFAPYNSQMLPGAPAVAAQQPGYQPGGMQMAQAGAPTPFGTPMNFGGGAPAGYGPQQPMAGAPAGDPGVQSAAYQQAQGAPGADGPAADGSWRPMAH